MKLNEKKIKQALVFLAGFSSLGLAFDPFKLDTTFVGQKILTVSLEDSILSPDLSKINLKGYDIDNAIFIDENDSVPYKLSPDLIDFSQHKSLRITQNADNSSLVLEAPTNFIPHIGQILSDTTNGGFLQKISQVVELDQGFGFRRWLLKVSPAEITEAILNCDIAFFTRLDLNVFTPSRNYGEDIHSSDSLGHDGFWNYSLKNFRILFQPTLAGRIKIKDGKLEILNLQLQGQNEISAHIHGQLSGQGNFRYDEDFPIRSEKILPLAPGLILRINHQPTLHMECLSKGDDFALETDFKVQNNFRNSLQSNQGLWKPTGENTMSSAKNDLQELRGSGEMKIALTSKVEVTLSGLTQNFSISPFLKATSDKYSYSRSFSTTTRAISILSSGNKALSFGSRLSGEASFSTDGKSQMFNFFGQENLLLTPPREGNVTIKKEDSAGVVLKCQFTPPADYYMVQQKREGGNWEVILDKTIGAQIHIANLKPNSQYSFRIIATNVMGSSEPFPLNGLAFSTDKINHPPTIPAIPTYLSTDEKPFPVFQLSWKSTDPDLGDKLKFDLYLESQNPPTQLLIGGFEESTYKLKDLKPNTTYYWKVIAKDSLTSVEGPIWKFTTQRLPLFAGELKSISNAKGNHSMVYVPAGSFLREDGKQVTVSAFLLQKYEATQEEFTSVTGNNPAYRKGEKLPVERVTWDEAKNYCQEIGGRLPTEGEWEYASRAGSAASFYWNHQDAKEYAWFHDNAENHTQRVGLKKPNAWGLHDMAGNVFEWVEDGFGPYSPTDLDNPKGNPFANSKVIRGASWYSEASSLGSAARFNNRPSMRNYKVGFRCAMDIKKALPEYAKSNELENVVTAKPVNATAAK